MAEPQPLHIKHHNISLDNAVLADHHIVEHAERLHGIRKVHFGRIRVGQAVAQHLVALLGLDRHSYHVSVPNKKKRYPVRHVLLEFNYKSNMYAVCCALRHIIYRLNARVHRVAVIEQFRRRAPNLDILVDRLLCVGNVPEAGVQK